MLVKRVLLSTDASPEAAFARTVAESFGGKDGVVIDVLNRAIERAGPEAVCAYAEGTGCDLIVQPLRRRSDLCRWVVGSYAERTVRASRVPVLTVPDKTDEVRGGAFQPRRILVPFDLVEHSVPVLRMARAWAECFGATVIVLHVRERSRGNFGECGTTTLAGITNVADRASPVDGVDRSIFAGNLPVIVDRELGEAPHESRVAVGDPHDVIVESIRRWRVDLVCMGAQLARGHLKRWWAVTDRVIADAACPVLTVGIPQGRPGVEGHVCEEDTSLSRTRIRR